MTKRWDGALESVIDGIRRVWDQPSITYLRRQDMAVWEKMSNNILPELLSLATSSLTEAEHFLLRAMPYLYEIGWQHQSSPELAYAARYKASAALLLDANTAPEHLRIHLGHKLQQTTIDCLATVCQSVSLLDLNSLPLGPIAAGQNDTARLRYVAALFQMLDMLTLQRSHEVLDAFPLPQLPRDRLQDIRLILGTYITLVQLDGAALTFHITLHPDDAPMMAAVAAILEEPIKQWLYANHDWLDSCGFTMYLKPSEVVVGRSGAYISQMPAQIIPYLEAFTATPFNYNTPATFTPPTWNKNTHDNEYEDFILSISQAGDYSATSSLGQKTAPAQYDQKQEMHLQLYISNITHTTHNQQALDEVYLRTFGSLLYKILFPEPIHNHWIRTDAMAKSQNKKMRLRLIVNHEKLSHVPWEFAFDQERGVFLAIDPDTLFTRGVSLSDVRRLEPWSSQLKVLAILSNPIDYPEIRIVAWRDILENVFGVAPFLLEFCPPHREQVRKRLVQFAPDIVYFVGHGQYVGQKGSLILTDPDTSMGDPLDDHDVGDLFLGVVDRVKLMTVLACDSGTTESISNFGGTALQIVQRGVSAVVAMQYPILISSAQEFLVTFAAEIAGHGQIDQALQAARYELKENLSRDFRSFATPVIYLGFRNNTL